MFIGNTRDRFLDRAEPELTLSPVVVEFGKYMKIVVVLNELVSMNQPQSRSVLDVMRQAQQVLVQPKTPSKTIERNNDKLFNALVDYLEEHGLFWRSDEVNVYIAVQSKKVVIVFCIDFFICTPFLFCINTIQYMYFELFIVNNSK